MSFILFGFVCLAYMVFATVLVMKYEKFKFKNRTLAIWVAVVGFLMLGSLGVGFIDSPVLMTLSGNLVTLSMLMFIAGMIYPRSVGMARRQIYYIVGVAFIIGYATILFASGGIPAIVATVLGLQVVVIWAVIALLIGLFQPSFVFAKTRLQGLMFMLPTVLGLQAIVYYLAL